MNLFKNKIFIYIGSRYLTYALQFVLSLLIAQRLGPFYMGVYGMINLILGYFGQTNFGIQHALNVVLVHNKNDVEAGDRYTYNALMLYTYQNILIVIGSVIVSVFHGDVWGDYDLTRYFPLIIITAVVIYYKFVLVTVLRVRNQINALSLTGTIPVLLDLVVVWFFEGEKLVLALTIVGLIGCLITMYVCVKKGVLPKKISRGVSFQCQKTLMSKGLNLFLYNSCFYFIIMSIRSIVSSNFSVQEFGYFTFSFTLANAALMLLDSINAIIFPKTLDVLSVESNEQKINVLEKMRVAYISTSHCMIYLAMLFFPLIVWAMPKYKEALPTMNMIAMAVLVNTNSYGFTSLLIAQNKEKISARISLIALIINVALGIVLVKVFNVDLSKTIIATLISYLVFSFLAAYEGYKLLRGKGSLLFTLTHFFPYKMLIPYLVAFVIAFFNVEFLIFIPFVLYVILNYSDFAFLIKIAMKFIKEPNVIDI